MTGDKQYKYLSISEAKTKPGCKTNYWLVYTKDENTALGVIRWYGAWRCYAFFPEDKTLYEHNCLWDIADFVSRETQALRQAWVKRRKKV